MGYVPDKRNCDDGPKGILREFERLSRELDKLSAGQATVVRQGTSSGGGSSTVKLEWVQSRHLSAPWTISERVAVTEIIMDNFLGEVVLADADTSLVEIAG